MSRLGISFLPRSKSFKSCKLYTCGSWDYLWGDALVVFFYRKNMSLDCGLSPLPLLGVLFLTTLSGGILPDSTFSGCSFSGLPFEELSPIADAN